jgi:hypothetical protein
MLTWLNLSKIGNCIIISRKKTFMTRSKPILLPLVSSPLCLYSYYCREARMLRTASQGSRQIYMDVERGVSERGAYLLWDPASWKKIRVRFLRLLPPSWRAPGSEVGCSLGILPLWVGRHLRLRPLHRPSTISTRTGSCVLEARRPRAQPPHTHCPRRTPRQPERKSRQGKRGQSHIQEGGYI